MMTFTWTGVRSDKMFFSWNEQKRQIPDSRPSFFPATWWQLVQNVGLDLEKTLGGVWCLLEQIYSQHDIRHIISETKACAQGAKTLFIFKWPSWKDFKVSEVEGSLVISIIGFQTNYDEQQVAGKMYELQMDDYDPRRDPNMVRIISCV